MQPDFRTLMDRWTLSLAEREKKRIEDEITGKGYVFFFKYNGEYFGSGEDGRIVFAKLKADDEGEGWKREAKIVAKSLASPQHEIMLGHDKINSINPVSREEAVQKAAGAG